MHVRFAILVVLLVVLAAPAAQAGTTAGIRMLECEPAESDSDGLVVYRARMSAVPHTARMSLRIRLFEKYRDGRFERVAAEQLGIWRKSRAGVSAFRYNQRIEGLRQGAVYRAVVHFRWFNGDGDLIQTGRRRSRACGEDVALPNLRVASVQTRPGEVEETAVYKVKIVNSGKSAARNVGVLLRVDGEVVDEAEVIDVIEPDGVRTVKFNGPVCRHDMRVVVDPKELIAESREEDNVLDPSCL